MQEDEKQLRIKNFIQNSNFILKVPTSHSEWECYHLIRTINIFEPNNVIYDPKHPSLTDPNNYHYLFFKGEEAIGVLQIEVFTKEACAIRTIAISDPYKNNGYGTYLLKLAEEQIKKLGAKVIHLPANPKAITFYERNGYMKIEFPDDIPINPNTIDMGKFLI